MENSNIEYLLKIGCNADFAIKFLKAIKNDESFLFGKMSLNDYEIIEIQDYTINKKCSIRKAFEKLQFIIL